ncbi:hypothetical protein DS2_12418 [Catenovulum agarivorans DS-2]|uniref:Uncharacterized protein n=1 Tax=Catenovulum agarivorans DS-2 TaxID=1328313 RepID=W7QBW1_9ALTE|nr:hypothetical protein DS2_12418 [Catenovulum agarivorans DS-2]
MLNRIQKFFLSADQLLVRQVQKHQYKTVSVYGIGEVGVAVVSLLTGKGIKLEHWYDSKIATQNNHYLGHTLTPYAELKHDRSEAIIIASEAFTEQIQKVIEDNLYSGTIVKLKP